MKNISSKPLTIGNLLSLAFGVAVFAFFAFLYPFHLNYQEQFQLFLFTPGYFMEFFGRPGGFSDYLGTFLTQFYFYVKIGAFIIAVLLVVLQRLLYFVARKTGADRHWIPLTFVPSLLYWNLLCDENYLVGGLVAMILLMLFVGGYLLIKNPRGRIVAALAALPVLYWLAGGIFVFFTLSVIGSELLRSDLKKTEWISFALGSLLFSVLIPFAAKALFLQFPLAKFWVGVTYFRFPVNVPVTIGVIGLLLFFTPFLLGFLTEKIRVKRTLIVLLAQLVVLTGFGYFFISRSADFTKEEIMAYDFHVRMRRWDRVIALADKKAPTSPLSVTCLNLALAKQDLLAHRMFSYYQNGMGGLIPDFTRDFTIPIIVGEVYYHLGLVNTAQRFAFEAMEALPDYKKSARAIKRLAETNIINSDYEVAKKYLHILQKTFYYRRWASNALKTIKDEKQIEQHIEWGWLRKVRIEKDFLFSEMEKENMLGQLFTHNPENRMAFEYLLASCLLKKDLQRFITYYPLSESLNYNVLPKSHQEALIYIWELTNTDPSKKISYPVSNAVVNRLHSFKTTYGQTRDAELVRKNFEDTFWYYLHFRN